MIKKISLFTLLLSLILLAGCAQKEADPNPEVSSLPDVIKIGWIGPLTGNAAGYGQDVKNGVAQYFKENSTIAGKEVQVIWEDGKCDGQAAANAAQKLITIDKVQVIIGGQCSGETLATAPIAEANKVVLLSPLSSSPKISEVGDYVFRNYPSDWKVTETVVEALLKDGRQRIAVFSEQTDYASAYSDAIKTHLDNRGEGARLVLKEAYAVDNTDFRTLLTKAKEAKVDALVTVAQTSVTNGFTVKQAREMGLAFAIYGTDTIDGPDFFNTAKDGAEGVKQIVVTEDPSRKGWAEFAASVPPFQSSPVFPAYGYDAANLVANGIVSVGYDGTALKDYFYSMPTFKGLASDIKFDAQGDNNVPAAVKVAKGGKFVLEK